MKNILEAPFMVEAIRTLTNLYRLGWDERNGGNLSVLVDEKVLAEYIDTSVVIRNIPISFNASKIAGKVFLVTGTGKYFKNVQYDPAANLGIVRVAKDGESVELLWGYTDGGRPTSELPTHLMNHEVKKIATGGKSRVIYHCHPVNVIALSSVLPLTDKAFTRALWRNMTECPIVFGEGVGVVPWMVCGGREIAVATAEKIKKYNVVIWAQHGIFCSGSDFDETFGLAHTVEKSAEIYVKIASMTGGATLHQTITDDNMRELQSLATSFGVIISPEFLD